MTEINKDMSIGDILGLPGFARRNSRAGLYGSRC